MRLLIPFPAGGSTEFTALTLAGLMSRLSAGGGRQARVGDAGIVRCASWPTRPRRH
jgi:hypothetical protein